MGSSLQAPSPPLKSRFCLLFAALAAVLTAVWFYRGNVGDAPEANEPPAVVRQPTLSQVPTLAPAITAAEGMASLEAFERWSVRYLAAPVEARLALRAEGIRLAKARRAPMLALIQRDPREALARAVPMRVRQDLPSEVVAQLEERVNHRGFFGVLGVLGSNTLAPIRRTVEMPDGQNYEAFVYGRRALQSSTPNDYLDGVALDRKLALSPRPFRVLEAGERLPAGKTPVEICPVSGKKTEIAPGDEPPVITSKTAAVEVGGTIHFLCSGGHIAAFEKSLIAAEGSTGGASKASGTVPGGSNTGAKTHLYMRITFADQLQDPQSEKDCYDMMRQVNDFMIENSYGKCYFLTTVTPLLVLPRTEAWYNINASGFANEVLLDARVAAKAAGYDPAAYDFDTVRYNGPGSFGGQAYVGGKGCWLKGNSVGVACHEYGHNLGLWHANYWNTTPPSVIGPGANQEYGNSFDTMGAASAGNNHFGAYNKSVINWMTPELVTTVRQSGTYRIFQHDQAVADQSRKYGLKIAKDSDRNYWCEFRQKFSAITWMMSGIQITWDAWGDSADTSTNGSSGGPQLLDMTPGSTDGKNDAQLVIGRTFSDREAGVHITTVGKGGTVPESMDVVVNLGDFPGNQAPTLTLTPSATTAATNTAITFTADAVDTDGDTLAYAWDFGDKSFSTSNAPVVNKSWSAAGSYTVRCTVSDMKGKTATQFVVVKIGAATVFSISGTVTDPAGQPLEGVLVQNALPGTSYRGAYTDSAGNYAIANVAAGSQAISASLFGYVFTAGFTSPIVVAGDVAGMNFTSTATPTLTIEATDPAARENSSDTGTFMITRTGATTAAQLVKVVLPSGTASKGTDYTLLPDPIYNTTTTFAYELTIPAGSATLNVVLTPTNDSTAEGPETAVLQLIPVAGLIITGPGQATVVIDDDDTALPRVSITATDEFGHESGDPAGFTVKRTGPVDADLTVNFSASGTAVNGTDYASIGTSVLIPAGAASAPLTLTPTDDTFVEGNETATVTLTANAAYVLDPTATAANATMTDDDVNVITVTATDAIASETAGDTGTFTITRTGDLTNALIVDYALTGSALHATDYARVIGVATIAAGEAFTTVSVIPLDDAIGETAQTATLHLRSKTTYLVGTPFTATINLNDNDLPSLSVAPLDGVATEPASGTGTDNASFRIYRAGGSTAFTARYTVSGTATPGAGGDYTALTGTAAFGAGTATVDVSVSGLVDALFENMETVTLTLTPDPAYTVEPENTATVQILDQDQPAVSVSTEATSPTEGSANLRFWVSRSGPTTNPLDVSYTMSGGASNGADYTGATGTVTIAAASVGSYVTLVPVNDTLAEGAESVTLTVTPNPGTYGTRTASATYLLGDNDTAGLTSVRFLTGTESGSEFAGVVNIPVVLNAPSSVPVMIDYVMGGTASSTATAGGVDYSFTNGSLTFAPGEVSKTIPLSIRDDNIPEGAETISITLVNPSASILGTPSVFTYTINDVDATTLAVGFATAASSGYEGVAAPQSLVVALSTPSTGTVTVNYAVMAGTASSPADYSLPSGTLTFAPGETSKRVPLAVVSDAAVESSETITVTLSNPAGAPLSSIAQHTFTILDDTCTVTITAGSVPGEGGATGNFTLTRSGSSVKAIGIGATIGGSATPGSDYQAIGALSLGAGQTSLAIPVSVINDTAIEGTETVSISLLAGPGYTLGAANSATLNITDDDRNARPGFSKGANVSVNEDAPAQSISGWATNINPGAPGEAGQQLTFTLTPDNPALFSSGPALGADGTLTFTPASNANGFAGIVVVLKDDGGTVNGGADTSTSQSFTIIVTAVNDPPTLNPLSELNTTEDAATITIPLEGISRGAPNEPGSLTVTAMSDNPALIPNPAVSYQSGNATGSISLRPVADAFGSTTIRVSVGDGGAQNGSVTQTFTAYVTSVNDPPTFTKGGDLSVLEDAGAQTVANWATAISPGPANEAAQAVEFTVGNDRPALFTAAPAIAPNGTLTFTPAPDANGVANVTVTLRDNGGGNDASTIETFRVTVKTVNDVPLFTKGADVTLLEDPGAQVFAGWAMNISEGPGDEVAQTVSFLIGTDNDALFAATPAIAEDGTLRFTPAANVSGQAMVTVRARDDGGTEDGGVDVSAPQTFLIAITAANDPPSFTKGPNVTVAEDAGAQVLATWASEISAGPADEASQTVLFDVQATNLALFAAAPTLGADGTLRFTPAADAHGSSTVTLVLRDNGGTDNGGADAAAPQSFTIQVSPVNDAPTLSALPDLNLLENAVSRTVDLAGIGTGAANETESLAVTAVSDNPALLANPVVSYTSPAATGTLSFQTAASLSGTAKITVTVSDGGTENSTAVQTFTVNVAAVNDAPSFTKGADISVTEDAGAQSRAEWATQLSAGPPDESTQQLDFIVTNDNPALFSAAPSIGTNAALKFTPAANANGTATVRVKLHDNGGTAGGGSDTSAEQAFTITVRAVNDAPSFTKPGESTLAVKQNAGAQTLANWATAISAGPSDESAQTVDFQVSHDNAALFAVPPAITPEGTLTFTPASNANGSAIVTVRLHDSGGVADAGVDLSSAQTFMIASTQVNDAPSFTAGADQSAAQDAGPHTVVGWARDISPGPEDEAAQTVDFQVVADETALFTAQPAISPDGTLTYTAAASASGTAIVTVRLHDSGGTANGGVDLSPAKTFRIAITTFAEEAGTYHGLVQAAPGAVPAAERFGVARITVTAKGTFTGQLRAGALTFTLKGAFDKDGVAHFGSDSAATLALKRRNQTDLTLALQLDVAAATDKLTGTVKDGATAFATIETDRALYTARRDFTDPFRNVRTELLGKYTIVFAAKPVAEQGIPASAYPQGHGVGMLTVNTKGVATLTGTLADGRPIRYANSLSKANTWPLYVPFAGGKGSLSGWIAFADRAKISDLEGLDLHWFKPASAARLYPAGWASGIKADLLGAKYTVPERAENLSILPGLTLEDTDGNADFMAQAGGLPTPGSIRASLNISALNRVAPVAPNPQNVAATAIPLTGTLSGAFIHPGTQKRATYKAVILQKQQRAAGHFISGSESGSIAVWPAEHPGTP